MKLKSKYSLHEVNEGRVHIYENVISWRPRYLCGTGYSSSDKKLSKNNVVETEVCKNCLKVYNKKGNKRPPAR